VVGLAVSGSRIRGRHTIRPKSLGWTAHGINREDPPILRINLRRGQVLSFFRKLTPTVVVPEACSTSHYWARELNALGHSMRLIPPRDVKRGKNDRNDAEAICEAAGRPGMHFVPAQSVEQHAQGMVLTVRETLKGQRCPHQYRGCTLSPSEFLIVTAGRRQSFQKSLNRFDARCV